MDRGPRTAADEGDVVCYSNPAQDGRIACQLGWNGTHKDVVRLCCQ